MAFSCAEPSGVPCLMAGGVAHDTAGVFLAATPSAPAGAGAPSCVTVRVRPPIVMVPVRLADAVFAFTSNGTVPLPDPLAVHTVTQARGVVAAQRHPVPV